MMEERVGGELGQILIAAGVIEQLVLGAIAEQEELIPLNRTAGDEGLFEALAKAYKGSGVKVTREGEELKVELQMIAKYGINIPEAARHLMELLRERLRRLAGLEVVEVELEIKGLWLPH